MQPEVGDIVVVTKFYPTSDIDYECGIVTSITENGILLNGEVEHFMSMAEAYPFERVTVIAKQNEWKKILEQINKDNHVGNSSKRFV